MYIIFLAVTGRFQTISVNEMQSELPTTEEVSVSTKPDRSHLPSSNYVSHQEQSTVVSTTGGPSRTYSAYLQSKPEHRTQYQSRLDVTTQDVLGCLAGSHSMTLEAEEVWLRLDFTRKMGVSPLFGTPSMCWLQAKGRGQGVMSLLVFNVSCLKNNSLVVHSQIRNRHSYNCDPSAWVAPGTELLMTSHSANVSIEVRDLTETPFVLHAKFQIVPDRIPYRLEARKVTPYLGMSQWLSSWSAIFG